MEILITEAASGDADAVAERLTAAGHQVTRCNLAGSDRCAALAHQHGCPLRQLQITAVVDVRREPVEFGHHELGAMCAVQAGIPLVVCGPTPDEAGPWRDADVRCSEDAVLEVLSFANLPAGTAIRHRIEHAVGTALATAGRVYSAAVTVRSDPGVVVVTVKVSEPLRESTRKLLQTAVRGSLAGVTPHWAEAQVTIEGPRSD